MRAAQNPPAFDNPQLDAEFFEAFLRDQVDCLFDLAPDCDDIATWLIDEDRRCSTSFISICEGFDTDPRIIRREILREFHRRNLRRLALREKAWERVRDWYLRPSEEDRFLTTMAKATGIPAARMAQDAFDALADPRPFVDLSFGGGDFDLLTPQADVVDVLRSNKEAA